MSETIGGFLTDTVEQKCVLRADMTPHEAKVAMVVDVSVAAQIIILLEAHLGTSARELGGADADTLLLEILMCLDRFGVVGIRLYLLFSDICRRDMESFLLMFMALRAEHIDQATLDHALDNRGAGIDFNTLRNALFPSQLLSMQAWHWQLTDSKSVFRGRFGIVNGRLGCIFPSDRWPSDTPVVAKSDLAGVEHAFSVTVDLIVPGAIRYESPPESALRSKSGSSGQDDWQLYQLLVGDRGQGAEKLTILTGYLVVRCLAAGKSNAYLALPNRSNAVSCLVAALLDREEGRVYLYSMEQITREQAADVRWYAVSLV